MESYLLALQKLSKFKIVMEIKLKKLQLLKKLMPLKKDLDLVKDNLPKNQLGG